MILDFLFDGLAPNLQFPPLFGRAKRTTLPVRVGTDDGSGHPVKMVVEAKFAGHRGRWTGVVLASHDGHVYLARAGKESPEAIEVVSMRVMGVDLKQYFYPEVWAVRTSATKKTARSLKDRDFKAIVDACEKAQSGPFLS